MNRPLLNRPLAAFVLLTFCVSVSCTTWRAASVDVVSPDEAKSLVGKIVRFHTPDGENSMKVRSVDYPYVEGRLYKDSREYPSKTVRVDMRRVRRIEVQRYDVTKSALIVVLVVVSVTAAFVALVVVLDPWEDAQAP